MARQAQIEEALGVWVYEGKQEKERENRCGKKWGFEGLLC